MHGILSHTALSNAVYNSTMLIIFTFEWSFKKEFFMSKNYQDMSNGPGHLIKIIKSWFILTL